MSELQNCPLDDDEEVEDEYSYGTLRHYGSNSKELREAQKKDLMADIDSLFEGAERKKTPKTYLEDVGRTLERKNADYSDCWTKESIIRRVISQHENELVELDDGRRAVVLEEPAQPESFGQEVLDRTWTGIFNKIVRSYRLTFCKNNDVEGETVRDAYDDLIGYAGNARAQIDEYEDVI